MPLSRDPSRKAALKRSETVLHRGKAILQVAYFGGQGQNTRAQQLEADFFVAHELVGRMTYRSLGRYGGNNEDFVLVGLRRRGKSAGVQDAIEGGVEATVEAIK